jgi:hypothetical protein
MLEELRLIRAPRQHELGRLSGVRRRDRGGIDLTPTYPQVIRAVTAGAPQGHLTPWRQAEQVSKEEVD